MMKASHLVILSIILLSSFAFARADECWEIGGGKWYFRVVPDCQGLADRTGQLVMAFCATRPDPNKAICLKLDEAARRYWGCEWGASTCERCGNPLFTPRPRPTTTVPETTTTVQEAVSRPCRATMHGYVFNVSGGWVGGARVRCSNKYNDYIATSGTDGYYSIQGMECGKYTCSVFANGFKSAYAEILVTRKTKRKDFYLTMEKGNLGTLEGYVFKADGGPVGDAYVKCGNEYFGISDPDGYFKIVDMERGRYDCSATAEGFKASFKSVSIEPRETKRVVFYLFPEGGSSTGGGQTNGTVIINATQIIVPPFYIIGQGFGSIMGYVRDEETLMPIPEAGVNCRGFVTYTDVFGRYRIDGLPEGSYLCYAEKPGYERETLKAFVYSGVASRVDFSLRRKRDCIFDAYLQPEESIYRGPEAVFHISVYDGSVASCGDVVSYYLDFDQSEGCKEVGINIPEVSMARGSHAEVMLYAAAERGRTCNVDLKVLDSNGNLRAIGTYAVINPGIDTNVSSLVVYGPERVEIGQRFFITAEAFDPAGIRQVRIFFDGNMQKACPENTCEAEIVTYEEGEHEYYAEAIDNNGNKRRTPTRTLEAISPSPRTGSLSGKVFSPDGQPIAGASIVCAGKQATSDETGDYYFISLPSGEVDCTAFAPGHEEVTKTINIPAGATATYNFLLAYETGGTEGQPAVRAKEIRADIVRSKWYWIAKYLLLLILLVMLVFLVIYYIVRKKSAEEEEELLRELEKYK